MDEEYVLAKWGLQREFGKEIAERLCERIDKAIAFGMPSMAALQGQRALEREKNPKYKKTRTQTNSGLTVFIHKAGVKKREWENAELELFEIDKILDDTEVKGKDRGYFNRRKKALLQQSHDPTSRQKAIGIKKGYLTKAEREAVKIQQSIDAVQKVIDDAAQAATNKRIEEMFKND